MPFVYGTTMKTPDISLARARELIDYNPLTGSVIWKVQQGLARVGEEVGTVQAGYRKTTIDREQIKIHRLVWFLTNGVWPSGQIDHIDGNKLNNAIANLRDVSMSVNMQNRYAIRRKDSELPMGVTRKNNKFAANIRVGVFSTAAEAHEAYMRAKRLIHDGCTR